MIYNLHVLRALAALAVAFLHITWEAGLGLPFKVGGYGVDVFFVISGFIMSYQRSESAGDFAKRRIIRIVPFYWCATLVVFAVAAAFPHLLRSTRADFIQLVCSLLFIPRETDYAGLYPTLVLGWSLNYEMYFYAVFALCLAIVPRIAPVVCAAMIGLVAAAISMSGVVNPSIQFYARELVLEFALGIGCFYACRAAERTANSAFHGAPPSIDRRVCPFALSRAIVTMRWLLRPAGSNTTPLRSATPTIRTFGPRAGNSPTSSAKLRPMRPKPSSSTSSRSRGAADPPPTLPSWKAA